MKLLGEFLLDPAWHCNVVNNPIMLAPSLLQGSIGKSRKGNLAWDTNLFLGGAVLPASRKESGGVIKLHLIILLQIQKLCSFLWRPYFFVITIHHNFSHENTVCLCVLTNGLFKKKAVETDLTNFRVRFENLNCVFLISTAFFITWEKNHYEKISKD